MKQDRLSHCLGDVDEKFVAEAEEYKKSSKGIWLRLAAVAACLCLIVSVLFLAGRQNTSEEKVISTPLVTAPALVSPPTKPDESGFTHVPAIELPENIEPNVAVDMMGLIVYQGRIYTQAKWYYGDEAKAVLPLVGEKLGYAVGTIDEWSTQDEYAVEFASTHEGDVYAVHGYSKDFRICMSGAYEDENGEMQQYVEFFENLNGISISSGKDVFSERLGLLGNWTQAFYQTHYNWDHGAPNFEYNELSGVSAEELDAFIEDLYAGEFEYVYEKNENFYSDKAEQRHLRLRLNDGTIVELRLFEGGYVGYQHLGWYFVQMSGEAFDLIFEACE